MTGSPFVMIGLTANGEHSEPLTVQLDKDRVDTLWSFIGMDNRLATGGGAMAQFISKGNDFFACLADDVRVDKDRTIVKAGGPCLPMKTRGPHARPRVEIREPSIRHRGG